MSEKIERRMTANVRHGATEFHIAVIGAYGAIDFHFWTYRPECGKSFSSLGVEFHRRASDEEGNRPVCDLIGGGPCFHDGTSSWADDYVMPAFERGGSDAVYEILERRYADWATGE